MESKVFIFAPFGIHQAVTAHPSLFFEFNYWREALNCALKRCWESVIGFFSFPTFGSISFSLVFSFWRSMSEDDSGTSSTQTKSDCVSQAFVSCFWISPRFRSLTSPLILQWTCRIWAWERHLSSSESSAPRTCPIRALDPWTSGRCRSGSSWYASDQSVWNQMSRFCFESPCWRTSCCPAWD